MKRKNQKAFTLIELLAVIVILAILLAIAVPKVTQYITKSRKDSLIATANDFIDAVRNSAHSDIYDLPIGTNDVTIVSLDLIGLSKGGSKSPFSGNWIPRFSYVAIINVGTDVDPDYKYYIAIRDTKRYSVALTEENKISNNSIIRDDISFSKVGIDEMCGSKDGSYKILRSIKGLEKYETTSGWNATVYSSASC